MGILSWWKRPPLDLDEDDFKEEIRAHLAIAAEEKMADGAEAREARYAAVRELGNVTLMTEATRRVWTPGWLDMLRGAFSDGRYAVRALAKHRAFSVAVVTVLALGIGLNAAVFTMLKGIFLAPLAGVAGSARLVTIFAESGTGRTVRFSYPDFQHLHDHSTAFSGLFGSVVARINLGRGRSAHLVWGELVTGDYFQTLGVPARVGRTLLPSDDRAPGRHPVVVISDALWRRDFNGAPDIVGKTIELNNVLLTIAGVADPEFRSGTTVVYDVDVYVPITMAPDLGFTFGSQQATPSGILGDRRGSVFYAQGYLRPGATLATAAAEAEALWAARVKDRALSEEGVGIRVVPFWQTPAGAPSYILPTLGVLSVMALLVLAIACANIAGLVVVRGVSRRGEVALRLALGASRLRIVRLLMIENLVLAIPGALLGVLLAQHGIPVLVGYAERLAAPDRIFFNIAVDRLVIGYAALVACGSALIFGFLPALQSARVNLVSVISEDASPRGAVRARFRSALVVAQVAVSLLLLVGAGLMTRSLDAARRAYPGFDPNGVASLELDLKQNAYDERRGRPFYRALLDAARADAAVESATLALHTPLGMTDTRAYRVAIEGHQPVSGHDLAFMSNVVASDYFRTLRIPVVAGREFEDRDDDRAAMVAIVNTTLAQQFWGASGKAIGKRLGMQGGDWHTIVGVVADVKYARINEPPRPYIYLPFGQNDRSGMTLHARRSSTLEAGGMSVETLVRRLRGHVETLDANLPIVYAKPMVQQLRGALIFFNLAAFMLFIFGTAGMALASMGTFGLVSYTVKQRTHEIGIRIALGASRGSVVGQFLARGLKLGAIGTGLGVVVALGLTRLLASVLFGVSALDAISFARALAIVLSGVVIATIVPAWRAARTNPVRALRHQ